MMKRSMQWFGTLALMVFGALAFVACSSSDGDGASPSPVNPKMVGTWQIMMDEGGEENKGKSFTFNADGTWSTSFGGGGTYDTSTDGDGRILFNIYAEGEEGSVHLAGKFVLVSEGNVLNGEYRLEGEDERMGFVLKKPDYTYPTLNNTLVGRWKMTECSMEGAPVGRILVFSNNGEMYIEGDPHVGRCTQTIYAQNGVINCDAVMEFGDGPTISGTVPFTGSTVTLQNGTATLPGGGESISITATLKKQ